MNLQDFLPKKTVAEVAMNPAAYAQSVKQGQAEGVLVGFEFEVCVPEETIDAANRLAQPTNITPERINSILRRNPPAAFRKGRDKFNRLFTPKDSSRYPSFTEAYDKLVADRLEKIKELLEKIPNNLLAEYTRLARNKINRQSRLGFNWTAVEKQFHIAHDIGMRYIDSANQSLRGTPEYSDAISTARGIMDEARLPHEFTVLQAMWPRVRDSMNIIANINRYFDYDPTAVYAGLELQYEDPRVSDDVRYGRGGGFSGAAKVLKPALEQTMGADVVVFTSYHQRAKNMTSWYIEPDGSLHPDNAGDGAAEVVGPPELPNKALDSLKKFFGLASELKLYTSKQNGTGLHINVSIPKNIDVLKLAVFLGDQYVLKQFGRENNTYARSVMKQLSQPGGRKVTSTVPVAEDYTNPTQTKIDLPKLQQIAKDVSNDHFASISHNGKYISFRHAGGDYLSDYQAILNVVGRFVRAMVIAADPNAYRNEYLKAVTKLVGKREPAAKAEDNSAYIEEIKRDGLVEKTVYMYIRPEVKVNPAAEDFAQILRNEYTVLLPNVNYSVELNSAEAKSTLVAQSRPDGRARREMSSDESGAVGQFAVATFIPMTKNDAYMAASSQTRGVDLARTSNGIVGYRRNVISRIPADDPQTVRFMRQLQLRGRRA